MAYQENIHFILLKNTFFKPFLLIFPKYCIQKNLADSCKNFLGVRPDQLRILLNQGQKDVKEEQLKINAKDAVILQLEHIVIRLGNQCYWLDDF